MEKKVFLLNKPFQGGYTEVDGNIAHEIINFFRTDNIDGKLGGIYIYNNPWGHCGDDVYVEESDKTKKREYQLQYMLLTGPSDLPKGEGKENQKWSEFNVTHVIELKRILHHESTTKDKNPQNNKLKTSQEKIKTIIRDEHIMYGQKYIDDIYGPDDASLYVTFEASRIFVPKNEAKKVRIHVDGYKFQRNKGYVYSDKQADAYKSIESNIIKKLGSDWKVLDIKPLGTNNCNAIRKTFLDMILKKYSEECYTNILYSFLAYKDMMKKFVKEFAPNKVISKDPYVVNREKVVEGGRMDISASTSLENEQKQRVVIENKVLSDINGVKEVNGNKTSQLDEYYKWAKPDGSFLEPICIIVGPNYRASEISAEAKQVSPNVANKYIFVSYKDIASFIEKNKDEYENGGFIYSNYINDVVSIFRNFAASNRTEFFENLFLMAIIG